MGAEGVDWGSVETLGAAGVADVVRDNDGDVVAGGVAGRVWGDDRDMTAGVVTSAGLLLLCRRERESRLVLLLPLRLGRLAPRAVQRV